MREKSLSTNVLLNIIKQGCTIIFPLITLAYVAQVLGSVNYGVFNTAVANTSYFALFAALGVSAYAVREGAKIKDHNELNNFASEVFSINLISTGIACIGILIYIICFTGHNIYSKVVLVLSSGIILTTIGADWVNTIFEDYKYLTIRYIAFQIVSFVLIFICVKTPDDLLKYTAIYCFALYGGYILNVFYIRKYVKLRITFKIDKKHILPILVLFANAVAIVIYVNSDITILSHYCTESQVGIYGFSTKLYTAIKQLINAFIIVTLPRVSEAAEYNTEKYYSLTRKIFSALLLIAVPTAVYCIVEARGILLGVGGEKYSEGYRCFIILSIALVFAILGSFVSNNIVLVNRKEKISLFVTIISAFVNVTLNFYLIPKYGIEAAAITTLIAEAINLVLQLYFSRSLYNIKELINKKECVYFIGSILILAECLAVKHVIVVTDRKSALFEVILSACIGSIIYFGLLLITNNEIIKKILEKVSRYKHKII